jgi:hypothetical protein
MTKRRLSILLAVAIVFVTAVGGLAYWEFFAAPPEPGAAKAEDETPPAPPAKAPAPARQLTEKERLLVGTWKFENAKPRLMSPGYEATYEFAPDGTFTFSFRSEYVKHWSRRGKFRVAVEILVLEPESEERFVNLIEELTETRLVVSAQDGRDREVHEWLRVRRE